MQHFGLSLRFAEHVLTHVDRSAKQVWLTDWLTITD